MSTPSNEGFFPLEQRDAFIFFIVNIQFWNQMTKIGMIIENSPRLFTGKS